MGWTPRLHRIVEPGRRPYFRAKVRGRQVYLGTDHAAAARQFAALVANQPIRRRPLLVSEAINAWVAACPDPWRNERINVFLRWRDNVLLDDVDARLLADYLAWLQAGGFAAWTIIHTLRIFRLFLAWCAAEPRRWIDAVPPLPRLPRPRQDPRDLPAGQLAAILRRLPTRPRSLLQFIAETGCRPGEARRLAWECVRLADRVCVLAPEAHKVGWRTGRPRVIYLTPAAGRILASLLKHAKRNPAGRPAGPVFLSRLGQPYTQAGLRAILRRAGGTSVYALRHTFAQRALDTPGVRIEDVALLLGHADLRTVQLYAQVRARRALDVAASLGPASRRPPAGGSPRAKAAAAKPPAAVRRSARRSKPRKPAKKTGR